MKQAIAMYRPNTTISLNDYCLSSFMNIHFFICSMEYFSLFGTCAEHFESRHTRNPCKLYWNTNVKSTRSHAELASDGQYTI